MKFVTVCLEVNFTTLCYISVMFEFMWSDIVATLLVMTMISLMLEQIKSTETSDLILLRSLLMLTTFAFDYAITLSMLFIPIGIIICFL